MKNMRTPLSFSLLIVFSMFCTIDFCSAETFISPTQLITDSESIISSNQIFRLGFFSPGNVSNRYVGIWYNTLPGEKAVVWVANREKPVTDFSGVLRIHADGNLVILDGKQNVIWTTNVSVAANSTIAKLLDSGNLVLNEASSGGSIGNSLWESFEHPTDTVLQDMKFGTNKKIGEKQVLVSWKTSSDPSKGSFRAELEPLNIPQVVVWNGSQRHWRTGPWDGRVFIGVDGMFSNYLNGFNLLRDDRGGNVYVFFSYKTYPLSTRFLLNPAGQLVFNKGKSQWNGEWQAPQMDCQYYGKCGSFGFSSSFSSPICTCLRGYQPKSTEEWSKGNWSSGCIRKTRLQCEGNSTNGERTKEDGFLKYERMKVPDFVYSEPAGNLDVCKQTCLANCSCTAYSYVSGIGCMSWHGNLLDMEKFSTDGVDLYIRVAHSELDKKINATLIVTVTVLVGLFTVGLCMYIYWRWVLKQKDIQNLDELDLPMFNYERLAIATNNFCLANKLGEGGFGSVYKGKLPSGEEIAVKRLSKSSGQGIEEFKNEVAVISGLQHRNLVRLLGFCIEGEEKMLIYEYMPNKSLDTFLFDPKRKALLGWKMCFQIIEGISRGILYLHRDSRLRVIHRDLKPSNILLDKDLYPKIADFGMARIFGRDELQANTRRVVGTYGYMSPEYAMDGFFSEKSDVYSFGVLLLEIVTGIRNSNCYYHDESLSLKEHVWNVWNKDKSQDIIDPTISEPLYVEEILRCLQVGLLCVQDFANDRPTMSSIILMLTSEIAALPTPKRPVFTGRQGTPGSDSSYSAHVYSSGNNISITTLEGR